MTRWFALLFLVLFGSCAPSSEVRTLTVAEYESKVAGFWLGQLAGNIYGLSHEFQYLDEPGPSDFPLGYGTALERAIEVGGAFSDDDTDLEYMYLLQMEQYGVEPTYGQLTEAWKYHIRDRIWAANRVALTLMHHGYNPPETGSRENNPRWFEIDPQLVNEIWAVTAPGMTGYAVQKTAWAARITNDDFGIEPALFYAAMISEGFFESDIGALIELGKASLPDEGRFRGVVEDMQALHARYPDDWKAARQILKEQMFVRQPYNEYGWEPIDATLNGAAAVLALLYGEGDIQRTLDLACSMGWDADNQAATLTGLHGLIHGADALPDALLRPVAGWDKPFNDRYINVSRFDLPDASIEDQIRRLVAQGIQVVETRGGSRMELDGVPTLFIEPDARFEAPEELLPPPLQVVTVGDSLDIPVYVAGAGFELTSMRPDWVRLDGNRLAGVPDVPGRFAVRLEAGRDTAVVDILVLPPNQAATAAEIVSHDPDAALELLRDGDVRTPVWYSAPAAAPEAHFYGYAWRSPVTVSALTYTVGFPREEWGWFRDARVEIQLPDGSWKAAAGQVSFPEPPDGRSKYLQPGFVTYAVTFDPVETRGVRLAGWSGGHAVDGPPQFGTTLVELSVH